MLIFFSERTLRMFSTFATWMADGTFKTAPVSAKQVYTIHGLKKGQSFQFAYCLESRKTETTHKKMLEEIKIARQKYDVQLNQTVCVHLLYKIFRLFI